jgi:predicted DNA binding protein
VSVVTESSVPAESFALAHTLTAVPDARVTGDRLASHSRDWVLPFVWIRADDQDAVRAAMDDDPTVDRYEVVQAADEETLYNVVWTADVVEFVDAIADQHGALLTAAAADGTWLLTLRFVSRDVLTSFREYFHERGDPFELRRVVTPEGARKREFGLTPEQYETLALAVERGYYDVPRATTITELADELGVSQNAVSERLRRATAALVTATLGGAAEQLQTTVRLNVTFSLAQPLHPCMSDHPSVSQSSSGHATAGTEDAAAAPPVTVRLTESATNGDAVVRTLYDVNAVLGFPSVPAAYKFEKRLNEQADDRHDYQLTPDHESETTFFLRCQRIDR